MEFMTPEERFTRIENLLTAVTESQVRHEYVDGQIFEMSGATTAHELIKGNPFAALHFCNRCQNR